jgi:hypothetical protein
MIRTRVWMSSQYKKGSRMSSTKASSPSRPPVNTPRLQTRWIPKMNRMTPRTAKTIIATFTQIILSIGNVHPSRQQNHWTLPLSTQLNDCLIRRHAPFYCKNDFSVNRKRGKTYRKEWLRKLVLSDYLIYSCQVKPVGIISCHIFNTLSNSSWPKN